MTDAAAVPNPAARASGRPSAPILFEAILYPHRSLLPRHAARVVGVVALVAFGLGVLFAHQGAWPVAGFFGLDVALVYTAFAVNARDGAVFETIRLTDRDLVVERHGCDSVPLRWRFQPFWLRVVMDDPPRRDSRLTLTSHGRTLVIGAFLTPRERLEVADALRAALAEWREAPLRAAHAAAGGETPLVSAE